MNKSPFSPLEAGRLLYRFFASLRLTIVLLAASVFLVLFGTLDQVHMGIRGAQEKYFESLLAFWQYPVQWPGGDFLQFLHIPLPGGYLLGPLLVLNLFAAHFRYYQAKWKKLGIAMIHGGVILLLLGQLGSQLFQEEYFIWLDEGGESVNYLESFTEDELVLIDRSDPDVDRVVSIPVGLFDRREAPPAIQHPALPFRVRVIGFLPNAGIAERARLDADAPSMPFNRGLGVDRDLVVWQREPTFKQNERNITTAIVTLEDATGPLGTWLVSNVFDARGGEDLPAQTFLHNGKQWEIALRYKRHYLPASFTLDDFTHERHPGTGIPSNFASDITINEYTSGETRRALIFMNHPLRYAGFTFYQASFGNEDRASMLQVVRNPAQAFPYIASAIITLGLAWQFSLHLMRFARRNTHPEKAESNRPEANPSDGNSDDPSDAEASTVPPPAKAQPLSPLLAQIIASGLVAGGLIIAAMGFLPPKQPDGFDIAGFGQLPLLDQGRVKPIDTVARNALLYMRGKTTIPGEDESRLTATHWLLEYLANPDLGHTRPVFRIDDPGVTALLGKPPEEQKYFSFNEVLPHLEAIDQQVALVPRERERQNRYERALLDINRKISLYLALRAAFVPPPFVSTPASEYESLLRLVQIVSGAETVPQNERLLAVDSLRLLQTRYLQMAQTHDQDGLRVVPLESPGPDGLSWETTGSKLLKASSSGELDHVVGRYAYLSEFFAQGDAALFNGILADQYDLFAARGVDPSIKAPEAAFNHYNPFLRAQILYVIAGLVFFASWLIWPQALNRAGWWLLFIGFVLHTGGLIMRMVLQERPPVTNLYSSAIFVGWAVLLLSVFLERRQRDGLLGVAGAMIGFTTLLLAHYLSLSGDTLEMMRAVLDSNFWLATHVVTITIGYAGAFLAGALAILFFLRGILTKGLLPATAKRLEQMVFGVTCFALFFSFVGTILGGIWADQSWGRFWGWDPKENGALMIVLWTALLLHARLGHVVSRKGLMSLAIIGNIITAWSWFGTNMLGIGLHSYGFMDAAFYWLMVFVVSQLAVAALVFLPAKNWPSGVETATGKVA